MVENDVKQEILKLYYEEHKRSVDIAPIINKSPKYISFYYTHLTMPTNSLV